MSSSVGAAVADANRGDAGHGGGGNFAAGAAVRPSGTTSFGGGRSFATGGNTTSFGGGRSFATAGNNWNGGRWHGGGWRHRGGFWPGFAAGAAIGGLGSY